MDPITIFLFVILCICFLHIYYGRSGSINRKFPPGPKPLPLIGNMHIINMKRPFKTMLELSEKYGSVFTIQMGIETMVVLCGYETVKDALVNHADEFSGRPKVPIFEDMSQGHGVIFSRDDNWKIMRRFTLSTLRDFGMGKKILEHKINEECDRLVERFQLYKGKPFENRMILNAAIANIIISIVMGHRFDYEDPIILRLTHLVNENTRLVGQPMTLLYNTFPSLMRWLPGGHKTIVKNINEIKDFVTKTCKSLKKQLDVNDQSNLIDTFLVKQQEEKSNHELYFHNENLQALVLDLLGAGMETTTTTLRWSLLLMMKYPEIQKNVQREIEKVIGSSQPQTEHRKAMPYTDAVLHEIQRFGDIVPSNLPHITTKDVTFRGYFLPKGTHIIPLLTSVLRDKKHFKKPEEFYPEHFLDPKGNFIKNDAFMPFSAGRRSCAGENLAKMELFLFFTRLLQKFTFQPPPGADLDLTPELGFTKSPKSYEICALPRN
ncbi:cytochrome P450 2K1-like [Pelobates fuscus]|uniref:cytochrome P450 2K1-like n=1 Tax=Pelobates fuscus TaxID=191477 RepID=UPI002FE4501E